MAWPQGELDLEERDLEALEPVVSAVRARVVAALAEPLTLAAVEQAARARVASEQAVVPRVAAGPAGPEPVARGLVAERA